MVVSGTLVAVITLTLGWSVQAADFASSQSSVTVTIAPALEVVQWPDPMVILATGLAPGASQVAGPLGFSLRANAPWVIQVSSQSGGGHLREYDTNSSSYVSSGHALSRPVQWSLSETGPWTPLTDSPVDLYDGGPTGDSGVQRQLYLRTEATFDDVPLGSPGREYRLDLGYTVSLVY